MATALTSQYTRFTDRCNKVLAGGVVKTFEPNSLIPKITYQDPLATIPNLPEVVLDSTGRAQIYLLGDYRVQVYSNDGTLIEDNLLVEQAVVQRDFNELAQDVQGQVDDAIATIQPAIDEAVANSGNMIGAADKAALDLITNKPVGQQAMLDNGDIYRWNGTAWIFTGLNYLGLINSLIRSTDASIPPLILVDDKGWYYGACYADGAVETPLFKIDNSYPDGFIVLDERGWVLLEQTTSTNFTKDWSQKKFLLLGDSITETSNVEAGIYNSLAYRQNWFLYAYAMLEVKDFNNMARSGASYREYTGQLDWQKISHQVSVAISTGFTPDIVVIACGTNDGIDNLGDYDTAMSKNIADLNMALTAEALRKNLYNISQAYPNAKLFSCLPLQRADAETSTRQPLLDLIRKMSGRYGFTVIDCHNETGIVKDFEIWNASGRDLVDGLHPKNTGQIKQAKTISAKIKSNYQLQMG